MTPKKKTTDLLLSILTVTFIIFWVGFILLDYWQKHPLYYFSFQLFQYWDLTLILALIGVGLTWGVLKFRKEKKLTRFFNGLGFFVLAMLIVLISVGLFYQKWLTQIESGGGGLFQVAGRFILGAVITYLIIAICYGLGGLLHQRLDLNLREKDEFIVQISTGILLLVFVLFLLASVSLLTWWAVAPVLLGIAFITRNIIFPFVKETLLTPVRLPKKLNAIGVGSFYVILVIVSLNFISILAPMPLGFDSLTLYTNLPALIRDYAGLVEGNQPYNWSLFMSLGFVLFDSTAIALSLSFIGGFLCLFAMYRIGRTWLKIEVNYLLLGLLVFYLTPVVTFQSFAEMKIDLGLLFVHLCIVLVLINWLKNQKNTNSTKPETPTSFLQFCRNHQAIWLIGLLLGFALGIKLTSVFTVFAILAAIWYFFNGSKGFMSVFFISLGLIFLLRLDDISGLRDLHRGVHFLTWGALVIGIIFLEIIVVKDWKNVLKSFKISLLIGCFFLVSFFPWGVKNFIENPRPSVKSLLYGKASGPVFNLPIMEQNLQKK